MKIFILLSLALVLFFGCIGPQPTPPVVEPVNNTNDLNETPENTTVFQNTTPAPQPKFKPVHLYYELIRPRMEGEPAQTIKIDYYFDDKTTCDGRDALNGFVKIEEDGAYGARYLKTTIYLDNGEAVYSDTVSESDLAFDNAKEKMNDFDTAFYLPTLVAKGGKKMLSEEIWNATKPILFKNIAAFGTVGDYSLAAGENKIVSGLTCKQYMLAAKSTNMDGQIAVCVYRLSDPEMAIIVDVSFPQVTSSAPSWTLVKIDNENAPAVYYPECLHPIICPSISAPTQDDYVSCNLENKSIDASYDDKYCVTAFECISHEERARRSLTTSQGPGCQIKEEVVMQVAECWQNNGNINYNYDQNSGCITNVWCSGQPNQ